jgi:hypothetical protein
MVAHGPTNNFVSDASKESTTADAASSLALGSSFLYVSSVISRVWSISDVKYGGGNAVASAASSESASIFAASSVFFASVDLSNARQPLA